jgi:hypothetical protein
MNFVISDYLFNLKALILFACLFGCSGHSPNPGEEVVNKYLEKIKAEDHVGAFALFDPEFSKLLGADTTRQLLKSTYDKLGKLNGYKLLSHTSRDLGEEGRGGIYYLLHYGLEYANDPEVVETFNVLQAKGAAQPTILNRRIERSTAVPNEDMMPDNYGVPSR